MQKNANLQVHVTKTHHNLYLDFSVLNCTCWLQNLSPEEDGFFDLLSKYQGRRIDEQRCSLIPSDKNGLEESSENKENVKKKSKLGNSVIGISLCTWYY